MIDDTGTVGEPSLVTVQTYISTAIYLLNAGQYQTAYTMLGLAIRFAYALDLHRDDPVPLDLSDAEWKRRTWWVLVMLDLRCSTELGRPTATCGSALACSLPSPDIQSPHVKLEYHVWTAKLTAARLLLHESLARSKMDGAIANGGVADISAEALAQAITPLERWRDELGNSDMFAHLDLDKPLSFAPDFDLLPEWLQRQVILLSLHYHDIMSMLYRPFIMQSLSDRLRIDREADDVDPLSDRGLRHALNVIDIIFLALRASDLLYGQFELYSLQWNAMLNLVLFISAYPLAMDPDTAISKLDRAVLLFQLSEKRYAVARRANALCRKLRAAGIHIVKDANRSVRSDPSYY
ncbi:uncharacterized protein A1O5_09388 [Cladophialophora psammophila CBS 110553]|uniref:FHA domain-containing protein n=1 Tax=Cladophialophora psammophila CBS 110553 TaxID=1182543 RepID=W9WQY6_9EURO|nr:uncharacterized protein A1O5_09388 [Cladophialophora psammophila CBS 110553]EXJ67375.1 hypothetical protein A1O5_09388 [Cladophialophora psammophila CBS 110553]